MKEADKNDALEINANNKHINQLKEQRDLLRAKIATNAEEFTARNRALAEEKDAILAHFHRLKKRMNVFRKDERRRLTDLTKVRCRLVGWLVGGCGCVLFCGFFPPFF